MSEEWSPFREAELYLNSYEYFFPNHKTTQAFGDDPQIFESWLDENCPNSYCYAWLYKDGIARSRYVIGVPEKLVLAVKLMTGIDPLNNFEVKRWRAFDGRCIYELHEKVKIIDVNRRK